MAIITPPEANLPPESMQWGRSIDQNIINLDKFASINFNNIDNSLSQINSSIKLITIQQENLATAINQLNTASESKWSKIFYAAGNAATQQAYSYADVAYVDFTAPSWATKGIFLCNAIFSGYDSPTSGFSCTVFAGVHKADGSGGGGMSGGTSVSVPNWLPVYSGGTSTGAEAADTTPAPTVVPYAVTTPVNGGEVWRAACILNKNISGGLSSFDVNAQASVFWTSA